MKPFSQNPRFSPGIFFQPFLKGKGALKLLQFYALAKDLGPI